RFNGVYSRWRWYLAGWSFFLLSVTMTGCSNRGREAPGVPAESPTATVDFSQPATRADDAVRRVLDGLRQRKVRAVWEFLPPSFRGDVQQLVRNVAARLEERTWQHTVAVWQKARKVLPSKASAIFGQASEPASS